MTQTSEIDALFELPLAEFTAARNALASRLRKEGRTGEAERVKAIPKPSATAWAVNQLFWRRRKDMERLLTLGEKVREAQAERAANLRALLDERRKVVSDLSNRAAEILRDAGHAASPDAMRRMAITLESLAAWGRSNAEPQAGRLTADLEPLGFDGLAALLDGRKLEPAKVLPFQAAERAWTAARRDAERAEAALAKANARVEALEKQKREMDARFHEAQEEARAAASAVKKAMQAVAEAERALARVK